MLRCIDKAVSYCNTGLLQAGSHLARSPFGLRQAGGGQFHRQQQRAAFGRAVRDREQVRPHNRVPGRWL